MYRLEESWILTDGTLISWIPVRAAETGDIFRYVVAQVRSVLEPHSERSGESRRQIDTNCHG